MPVAVTVKSALLPATTRLALGLNRDAGPFAFARGAGGVNRGDFIRRQGAVVEGNLIEHAFQFTVPVCLARGAEVERQVP